MTMCTVEQIVLFGGSGLMVVLSQFLVRRDVLDSFDSTSPKLNTNGTSSLFRLNLCTVEIS
jgi:hypothetical protein